jgi:RimJ/RimL family protein N-acetyltransferase
MTHNEPITMASHLLWWDKIRRDRSQLRLIFEIHGDRAGFAKFYDIDDGNKCCTLGADIDSDHRGNGYAKHLWTLMLTKVFDEMHLHRAGLTTAAYNDHARSIYERLGFCEEGRLVESLKRMGGFHDQIMMFMLKGTWDGMRYRD